MKNCELRLNNQRRTCKLTENPLDNSNECFYDVLSNKCKINSKKNRIQTHKQEKLEVQKKYEQEKLEMQTTHKHEKLEVKKTKKPKKPNTYKLKLKRIVDYKRMLDQLKKSSFIFKIVDDYKKSLDRQKKKSLVLPPKNNHKLKQIQISPYHKFYVVRELDNPLVFDDAIFLGSGTNNSVYKVVKGSREYALRVTTSTLKREELEDVLNESELTIRLSGLGITPKIHDIYIANMSMNKCVLVVVSDLAIDDVYNFIEKDVFLNLGDKEVKELAEQTKELYKRMIDNDIICIDVKTSNMVVENNNDPASLSKFSFKNIDFDANFCSHKPSRYPFERIMNDLRNPAKECFISKKIDENYVRKLFLNISLLQISLMIWKNDKQKIYCRKLVEDILLSEIPDMCKACKVKIGSGKFSFDYIFSYYYLHSLKYYHKKCNKQPEIIPIETSIMGSLILALFGRIYKTNYCLP